MNGVVLVLKVLPDPIPEPFGIVQGLFLLPIFECADIGDSSQRVLVELELKTGNSA